MHTDTDTDTVKPRRTRTRNAEAYKRQWCACCGAELPRYDGRGRPARYCSPETGRPCVALTKALASVAALADKAAVTIPSAKRETWLRGFVGSCRQIVQDATLTVAKANGDGARAARVGRVDPKGFEG